jgi:rhombotail lipoprotein
MLQPSRRRVVGLGLGSAMGATGFLAGCASGQAGSRHRQVASVLSFLYPGNEKPDLSNDRVAEIRVPFRVGVAFVPDAGRSELRLAEPERQQLAGKVRDAFADYPFIRQIVAVESMFLQPGGGYDNLDRAAAMLNLDVVALISYDLVQHADSNGWSFLYWTGIGAYLVEGDQFDVLTSVNCAVIDIKSRRLLMHAGGTARDRGAATLVGFSEKAREARTKSFTTAIDQMIPALKNELAKFRASAGQDPKVKLILPPGYDPRARGTSG